MPRRRPSCPIALIPYIDRSTGWRIRDRKMVAITFTGGGGLILTLIGTLFRGPEWHWVWPWSHLYVEL